MNTFQQQPEELKKVMAEEDITWRSFVNPERTISQQWNSPATPSYYLIDHRGIIRHKWIGAPGDATIDRAVERLIEEAEAPPN